MSSKYPQTRRGIRYAEAILEDRIVSCQFIKGACKRFFDFFQRAKNKDSDFLFSYKHSENFLTKAQKFHHAIGQWDSPHIKYEDWQCFFGINVFGFINKKTKTRLFRQAFLEIGRGNSKTTMASQIVLYFMSLDKNLDWETAHGNFVYSAATKLDQAELTLKSAQIMVKKNEGFSKATGTRAMARMIKCENTFSEFKALSSESRTLDGLNASLIVLDELHSVSRGLFDVIRSGMIKRRDSLLLMITTAGNDITGPGFGESQFAKDLCLQKIDDDQYFALVYTLDNEKELLDSKKWIKANPNLGISVDRDYLATKVETAKGNAQELSNVKIKHFNLWNNDAVQFIDMKAYKKNADPTLKLEDFKGEKCFLGVDLASTTDLTSLAIVFRRKDSDGVIRYYFFEKTYLPEATAKAQMRDVYTNAIDKKEIIVTPGKIFNNKIIKNDIIEISKNHRVESLYYDKYNAVDMVNQLATEHYVETIEFRMNAITFTGPMKRTQGLILDGRFFHNGSGLAEWCFSNVEAKNDHNDNVFPRKRADDRRFKIDPAVACFMAMRGWYEIEFEGSVYDSGPIKTI